MRNLRGFFDVWSIYHFLVWFGVFFLVEFFGDIDFLGALVACIVTAYLWEAVERYWDKGWEKPFNRWISDPLVDTAGGMAAWYLVKFLER